MPTRNLFNNFTHLFNSMDEAHENLRWVPLAPSSQVLASENSRWEERSLSWVDESTASCSTLERTDHCLGTVDEDTRASFEGSVLSTKLAMGPIVWVFRTSMARIHPIRQVHPLRRRATKTRYRYKVLYSYSHFSPTRYLFPIVWVPQARL